MKKIITFVLVALASVVSFAANITCTEAVTIAQGLEPNTPSEQTYTVEGYVISVIKSSATDLRFWMADSLNVKSGIFEAWMCTGDVVNKGDKVTVTGNIQWYVNPNNEDDQMAEIAGGTVTVVEVAPVDMNYVEFNTSDFEGKGVSGTGGEISVTKNGVTVYTNAGFGSSYSLRVYKNKELKISADRRIVQIAFEFDNFDADYSGGLDPEVCVEGTEWENVMATQGRFKKISVTLGDGACSIHEIGDQFIIDGVTYRISSIGSNNTVEVYWYDSYSSSPSVVIPESVSYDGYAFDVTEIYPWAFTNNGSITSISLPNTLVTIGEGAFYGCNALADIYSYAINPPVVSSNTFQDVSKHCYIHVPAGTVRSYQLANVWRDFYHIIEISALPDGTTEVGVTVTNNYATFSWPVNPTASSYTLEITKDGELFCTLIFNSLGQLVGMAFAPGQGFNAPAAMSTSYGYSFVVTGLTDNTTYAYTFSVRDENDNIIETKSGIFSTTEGETPTYVDKVHDTQCTIHKVLRNGQILLERNNVTYTLMGQKVK